VQTQTSAPQDSVTAGPEAPRSAARRLNPIRLRQIEQRCHELEEEITRCEAEVRSYEAELIHFRSAEESIRVTKLLEDGRTELATLTAAWEELADVIEEHGLSVTD